MSPLNRSLRDSTSPASAGARKEDQLSRNERNLRDERYASSPDRCLHGGDMAVSCRDAVVYGLRDGCLSFLTASPRSGDRSRVTETVATSSSVWSDVHADAEALAQHALLARGERASTRSWSRAGSTGSPRRSQHRVLVLKKCEVLSSRRPRGLELKRLLASLGPWHLPTHDELLGHFSASARRFSLSICAGAHILLGSIMCTGSEVAPGRVLRVMAGGSTSR